MMVEEKKMDAYVGGYLQYLDQDFDTIEFNVKSNLDRDLDFPDYNLIIRAFKDGEAVGEGIGVGIKNSDLEDQLRTEVEYMRWMGKIYSFDLDDAVPKFPFLLLGES